MRPPARPWISHGNVKLQPPKKDADLNVRETRAQVRPPATGTVPSSRTLARLPDPGQEQCSNPVIAALTLASVLLISMVIVFLVSHYFFSADSHHTNYTVCETSACKTYSNMLRSALDVNRDPCKNFYNFVCSGWHKQNVLSVYRKHMVEFANQLGNSLRLTTEHGPQQRAANKASHFFQSCMNAGANREAELNTLRQIWQDCGVLWPRAAQHADVLSSIVCLEKKFNAESIISFNVDGDTGGPCLYIHTGTLVKYFHGNRVRLEVLGKYEEFYENYGALVMGAGTDKGDLLPFSQFLHIEDVIYNELDRDDIYLSDRRIINLTRLVELTSEISAERWGKLFATEFLLPSDCPIEVRSEENIIAFNRVLRTIGEKELHRYVGWFNIQYIAPYLTSDFIVSRSGLDYGRRMNIMFACNIITEFYMGLAMFSNYVQKEFKEITKLDIHSIIDTVGATASQKVANSPWVSEERPAAAAMVSDVLHRMLHTYTLIPTLDAVFVDLSNMGDGFLRNWVTAANWAWKANITLLGSIDVGYSLHVTVNVFYSFFNKRIGKWQLPPYATMLPLYETGISDAVKYGAFGTLLGIPAIYILREVYPSFDALPWGCLDDSPHVKRYDRAILDFALSSSVAWYAYKSVSQPYSDVRLPFLSDYSHEQLFFISFCYLMCGQVDVDIYTRGCNEPLRHNAEFVRAFSCPKSSAMNRRQKCTFF